ncbi:MAG: hypothetical protein WCB02_38155 [Bradyrhizobium sp.]
MVATLPSDRCNELMGRRIIRRVLEQRLSQRPCLFDATFAQCDERRVDRVGALPLVFRRLWVHVRLPVSVFQIIGITRARAFGFGATRGGVGPAEPSLQ